MLFLVNFFPFYYCTIQKQSKKVTTSGQSGVNAIVHVVAELEHVILIVKVLMDLVMAAILKHKFATLKTVHLVRNTVAYFPDRCEVVWSPPNYVSGINSPPPNHHQKMG
jgi:alkyl hydroperoxide reductase subunit AhpF